MQKKDLRKIRTAAVLSALILTFLLSAGSAARVILEDTASSREYEYVKEEAGKTEEEAAVRPFPSASEKKERESADSRTDIAQTYGLPDIDEDKLLSMNSEYAAWLFVPEAGIDLPVVFPPDNGKYLKRTFLGETNSSGCLFFDSGSAPLSSGNSIIHGHNMRNGTMFGSLKKFLDKEYGGRDVEAFLLVNGTWRRYLLAASLLVPEIEPYPYTCVFPSSQAFKQFLSYLDKNTVFTYAGGTENAESILSLSTCHGKGEKLICVFVRVP